MVLLPAAPTSSTIFETSSENCSNSQREIPVIDQIARTEPFDTDRDHLFTSDQGFGCFVWIAVQEISQL